MKLLRSELPGAKELRNTDEPYKYLLNV
jgi:hypothetical protein